MALTAFLGALIAATLTLWPRGNWRFAFSAKAIIKDYIEDEESVGLGSIHRDLALHLDDHFGANAWRLNRLYRLFVLGIAFMFVEVLCWLLVLDRR